LRATPGRKESGRADKGTRGPGDAGTRGRGDTEMRILERLSSCDVVLKCESLSGWEGRFTPAAELLGSARDFV